MIIKEGLKKIQFRVLYPVFFLTFHGKLMMYADDTHDKQDVLIIFDELQVQRSALEISFS